MWTTASAYCASVAGSSSASVSHANPRTNAFNDVRNATTASAYYANVAGSRSISV